MNLEQVFQAGLAALNERKIHDAEHLFRSVLRDEPKHVAALNLLTVTLMSMERFAEAEEFIESALRLDQKSDVSFYNYGIILKRLGKTMQAKLQFDKALQLNSTVCETWNNRGTVLNDLKQYDLAVSDFDKAISLNPNYCDAFCNKGKSLLKLKRYDDAFAAYDKAVSLKSDLADAWLGRGNVLGELKRYNDALAAFDCALALSPDLPEAWFGRGGALLGLKQHDNAFVAFDRALALKPDLAEAWLDRGGGFLELKQYDNALAAFDKGLALKPDSAEAWFGRANALFFLCRNDEALASYDRSIALKPDLDLAFSNKIFALDFSPRASLAEQQEARHDWWRCVGKPLARSAGQPHDNSRDPDRYLVIGYVSADFRDHSAAYAFGPILRNHDKQHFKIICYNCTRDEDRVTNGFKRAADTWREVSELSDDELAQQIRSDRIDILVDLSGHSDGNRLKTFARKPAPVQVTAWGHATGTGIPAIDYLFSDPVTIPESVRHLFAEKIVDLSCAMITEQISQSASRSDPPALKNGYCTFGVFNRAQKISDEAIKTWADILTKMPNAKLLMKDRAFDVESVVASLHKNFSLHGISSDRIRFLGSTPRDEHLAAYNQVDISLDPFPQNGGVSTWEALQMGVPVVAKLGATVSSRISGAILFSVGMSDWVAEGADGYVSIAVKNAAQIEQLAKFRRELAAGTMVSSVIEGASYTRTVEAAYRHMWRTYCHSRSQ